MVDEIASRPTLFAQDTHFRTRLYSRWLAAKGYERKDPSWAWPTWRDAELAKGVHQSRRKAAASGHAVLPLGPLSKNKTAKARS
jgi:hypothetical protein